MTSVGYNFNLAKDVTSASKFTAVHRHRELPASGCRIVGRFVIVYAQNNNHYQNKIDCCDANHFFHQQHKTTSSMQGYMIDIELILECWEKIKQPAVSLSTRNMRIIKRESILERGMTHHSAVFQYGVTLKAGQ